MADNTSSIIPIGGGSGGGAATSIVVGNAVTGGGINRVLFEDGSQNLAASTALKFTTASGLQVSDAGATTNVTIGSSANVANAGTGGTSVAIGNGATVSGNGTGNTVVGSLASNTAGVDGIAVGRAANSNGNNGVAVGAAATGPGVAIGSATTAATQGAAIGTSSTAIGGQFVAGSTNFVITDVYFNKGVTSAAATGLNFHGTGGSGADNAGGDLVLAGGISTGAGRGGSTKLQTAITTGTSSTANTLVDRIVVPAKFVTLSSGVATTILTVNLASGTMAALDITFGVRSTDGTDFAASGGVLSVSAVNKAGTVTSNASILGTNSTISTSGTLTVTASLTNNAASVDIKLTATQTIMSPSTLQAYITVTNNSIQTLTVI